MLREIATPVWGPIQRLGARLGTPDFVATPHLGASTNEAQVNVALQVAEQLADYLVEGGITSALNVPSLSAEEAPKLKPYMALAEKLGSLGRPNVALAPLAAVRSGAIGFGRLGVGHPRPS